MFKNRLEKIVWEEISNILKEADQEVILSLISEQAGKLVPGPAGQVINSQKFLTLIRNRIAVAARGGALRGGEADYFISFVFPRAAQRAPGGGWSLAPGAQTARAHRARRLGRRPWSRDAMRARQGGDYASPKLAKPEQPGIPGRRAGQRVQPPKSAGTVKDNLGAWPTQPWGAEAVEVRIANAATKSRDTFRSQVRQKGGIKDKHLQNADDVIDEALNHDDTEKVCALDPALVLFQIVSMLIHLRRHFVALPNLQHAYTAHRLAQTCMPLQNPPMPSPSPSCLTSHFRD